MSDNVVSGPFRGPGKRELNTLQADILSLIYSYSGRLTMAETIGVLEMVKLELYENAREE